MAALEDWSGGDIERRVISANVGDRGAAQPSVSRVEFVASNRRIAWRSVVD
jgi:hypothetical protein